MADKTVIVEIKYDTEAAVKNIKELTSVIEGEKVEQAKLNDQLKQGKISQNDYSIEVDKSKQKVSQANNERKASINLLASEKGSINELKSQIKALTLERDKLNQNTTEGKAKAQQYTSQIKEMQQALKGAQTEASKSKGAFASFGDSLGNLPGPLGGIISGIGGMTKAALAFIATPIGLIIAGIALALKALISYFKGSEEGQDKLNKIMMIFKVIIGNIGDLIQKVGKWIYEAVSKPKETIIELGNLIKENLINRFTAFGVIGKAIAKIFSGDFKQGFKDLANGAIQAGTGISNAIDKFGKMANSIKNTISDLVDETKREIEIAKRLADQQANLDKYTRNSMVQEAKDRLALSRLKNELDDKDKNNGQARLKIIDEENALLDGISQRNLNIAKQKYQIKVTQDSLSNSTKEDLNEEAQLLADVYNQEAAITAERKEAVAKRLEALAQIKAEEKLRIDTLASIQKLEQEGFVKSNNNLINQKDLALKNAQLEYETKLKKDKITKEEIELAEKQHQQAISDIDSDFYNKKLAHETKLEDIYRGIRISNLADEYQKKLITTNEYLEQDKQLKIEAANAELESTIKQKGISDEAVQEAEALHKAKLIEIELTYQQSLTQIHSEALKEALDGMQQIIEATGEMGDARVNIIADAFSKISTINFKEVKSAADAFAQIGAGARGLTTLIIQGHEAELTDLESQKQYELQLAGDNKDKQAAVNKAFAKKEAELKRRQAIEDKVKTSIDIALATAIAVAKSIAASPLTVGLPWSAIIAGLGAANIAAVIAKPLPQFTSDQVFAKGGVIGGRPHSQGGTKFIGSDGSMFEAEKGEAMFVLKKDATAEIAALSAINESHGGRSFTKGSSHLQDGGEVSPIDIEKSVSSAMQNTPIIVKVGDIATGLTNYEKVKQAGVI